MAVHSILGRRRLHKTLLLLLLILVVMYVLSPYVHFHDTRYVCSLDHRELSRTIVSTWDPRAPNSTRLTSRAPNSTRLTSRAPNSTRLAAILADQSELSRARVSIRAPWTPNSTRLAAILADLNLTNGDSSSQLPLTLQGPYVLSNHTLCATRDGSPVDILFFVHTATGHFDRRDGMRRTFMSEEYVEQSGLKVRRLFLLGLTNDTEQQASLQREQAQHGDLLQGRFRDSYHNLSHKGVLGYRWVSQHCPHVRLLVKMDDDVFFDTQQLTRGLWGWLRSKSRTIVCNVWKSPTMPILRSGKWRVSDRLFRNQTRFPYHYCSGMVVLITGDLVPSLLRAAAVTPVFWIDDVYLFGMLPSMAGNVTFYDVGPGVLDLKRERGLECLDKEGRGCPLLALLATGQQLDGVWNKSRTLRRPERWPQRIATV